MVSLREELFFGLSLDISRDTSDVGLGTGLETDFVRS